MATALETDLKMMLDRNSVEEEVQNKMIALKCISIEDFANWVDDKKELKDKILATTDFKDDASQNSRIKMAWRQAEAVVEKKLKRTSEGLTEEPLDDPLDEGVQKGVIELFAKTWSWPGNIIPERMGSDSLLGRVFREFQAWKPTLYPLSKVRSLASVQSKASSSAKRRVGDRVTLTFDGQDDEPADEASTILCLLWELEVLANTWVVAGAYKVEYQATQVVFAGWPAVYNYQVLVKDEATARLAEYTEQSVVAYVTAVEEAFRVKALGHVRSAAKVPWGAALTLVTKEHANYWDHKSDILVKRRPSVVLREREQTNQGGNSRGGGRQQNAPGTMPVKKEVRERTTEYNKHWETSKYDNKNGYICKPWNDPRGCKDKCPRGQTHCCDVMLSNGRICASTSHNRWAHRVADHGAPKKH